MMTKDMRIQTLLARVTDRDKRIRELELDVELERLATQGQALYLNGLIRAQQAMTALKADELKRLEGLLLKRPRWGMHARLRDKCLHKPPPSLMVRFTTPPTIKEDEELLEMPALEPFGPLTELEAMESVWSDDDGDGQHNNNSWTFGNQAYENVNGEHGALPALSHAPTDLEADTPRIHASTDEEETHGAPSVSYSSYAAPVQQAGQQVPSTYTPRLVGTDGDKVTWELNVAQPLGWECYQFQGGDTTVAKIYPQYQAAKTEIAVGDKVVAVNGYPVETSAQVNWVLQGAQWGVDGTRPVHITFLVPLDE